MTDFERQVTKAVREIRDRIANETDRPDVVFTIRAAGRVNDGDMELTYNLENTYDNNSNVKGGELEHVVCEYIRRNAWAKRHAPLCLPKVE